MIKEFIVCTNKLLLKSNIVTHVYKVIICSKKIITCVNKFQN